MEMKREGLSIESAGHPPTTSCLPAPETSENLTLKQVIANTVCSNKLTFVARVTDFISLLLDDATFFFLHEETLRRSWEGYIECDNMLNCRWRDGLLF
ncbi:hypothetical protein K503DRAFT_625342 [Rhizopogon vinicolor AM-OR11-026]|uniref:Uncharacterized protein n=1 Tax=Rhizopogon vinicolor AM-OR11-026 TaxID=1314800 RepID=A0A1B7N674_9AGAM|nr:hypothetical protein K503DRAFT_625342 [Rhizopogon vinicolor AM-OR11-026]